MRRRHLEELKPVCPRCRQAGRDAEELMLHEVYAETDGFIDAGILNCPHDACRQEYPIIDSVPIIVPDVRAYLTGSQNHILWRDDLPDSLGSLIGDALGPATDYDQARQHLSIYCWGHYADLDPEESNASGSLIDLIESCLSMPVKMPAPGIDLGCSIGRSTFELAAHIDGLTVGIDLNYSMLRKAQQILHTHTLNYDRRRIGLVYDRHEFPVEMAAADDVDFWACDALALPFRDDQFGAAIALNLFDCVSSPLDLLATITDTLMHGGSAILATPYDWAPTATAVEAWIGGHSQRGKNRGAAEPLLRALLTAGAHPQSIVGLKIAAEEDRVHWVTRLHDRSRVRYDVHVFAVTSG